MNTIAVQDLVKTQGEFTLGPLNFTLPGGCILGLIGENGAGKSTTIRLLLGLDQGDRGTISLLDRQNGGEGPLHKEEIGVVLDRPGLPECLTPRQLGQVMERVYPNWDQARYRELVARFKLEDKPFKDFSQGMKMKMCLAVALAHHSRLLILDEATNGLDPVARDQVVEMLREFVSDEEHGVLISSHIVSDLEKLCDYVAFLHQGQMVLWEEKDRLLAEYGIFRGSAAQLEALDPAAVCHKRVTPYGAQALVVRDKLPQGTRVSPVSLEDLFVQMVKEDEQA